MRLFVAGDLPPPVREALARRGRDLAAAGGWRAVPETSLHLTLAFLGERPAGDVPRIAEFLEQAAAPCDPVMLGAPILLPRREPRVAAVELADPSGSLVRLQASVAGALAALGGLRPESRPYLPHVTVARRARGPRGEVSAPDPGAGAFRVPSVALYRSTLSRAGARYEALARIALPA